MWKCFRSSKVLQINKRLLLLLISSVQFNALVVSDSVIPRTRLHCPSPTPEAYSNSCPLSQWCHPTISSCVVPFTSHLQSFPTSGSFPVSQFFASGGQSIGVSASASDFPTNIRDWFPLGLTALIHAVIACWRSKQFSLAKPILVKWYCCLQISK